MLLGSEYKALHTMLQQPLQVHVREIKAACCFVQVGDLPV
jgi:hypothetical protein